MRGRDWCGVPASVALSGCGPQRIKEPARGVLQSRQGAGGLAAGSLFILIAPASDIRSDFLSRGYFALGHFQWIVAAGGLSAEGMDIRQVSANNTGMDELLELRKRFDAAPVGSHEQFLIARQTPRGYKNPPLLPLFKQIADTSQFVPNTVGSGKDRENNPVF